MYVDQTVLNAILNKCVFKRWLICLSSVSDKSLMRVSSQNNVLIIELGQLTTVLFVVVVRTVKRVSVTSRSLCHTMERVWTLECSILARVYTTSSSKQPLDAHVTLLLFTVFLLQQSFN